ncbi:hypothetical protein [Streptomyces sp. EN23]|uniref:hypothetical protein n=1 Tax=Streptomyces sp. EN23 TaxID=212774 RepID=UPI000852141E|nr:hypothetical protein [Streptomyces sp. EN23]
MPPAVRLLALYTIRFRSTRGRQSEESGHTDQDAAVERLIALDAARRTTPRSVAEQQETLGEMAFEEYAKTWFARKRGIIGLDPLLDVSSRTEPTRWAYRTQRAKAVDSVALLVEYDGAP